MTNSSFGVSYGTSFITASNFVNLHGDGGYSNNTLEAAGDISSIDTDGFTLNWTTTVAYSYPTFGFMCLPGVVFIPQIYRLVRR
jgi:hypothetical protein